MDQKARKIFWYGGYCHIKWEFGISRQSHHRGRHRCSRNFSHARSQEWSEGVPFLHEEELTQTEWGALCSMAKWGKWLNWFFSRKKDRHIQVSPLLFSKSSTKYFNLNKWNRLFICAADLSLPCGLQVNIRTHTSPPTRERTFNQISYYYCDKKPTSTGGKFHMNDLWLDNGSQN